MACEPVAQAAELPETPLGARSCITRSGGLGKRDALANLQPKDAEGNRKLLSGMKPGA